MKKNVKLWTHQWRKLVVDGKIMRVYPKSRVPKEAYLLSRLCGIELKIATREERKPFLRTRKIR